VDCHLIHGCEISPDSEDIHVKQLIKVQIRFIHQLLNLHPRSVIAALFTETGIIPLRVRRFLLVLKHLIYFLGLEKKDYARAALDSSLELCAKGKASWAKDLIKAATRLPFDCPVLVLTDVTSIQDIENYGKAVNTLMQEWLQESVDSNEKLYLLRGRLEPQKDKPPTQITSKMRHYLTMVSTQVHREALTSLLLSTHRLALEILRYVDHEHLPVPRSERLCRFCKMEVETPEHALITCTSSDAIIQLRSIFLPQLFHKAPHLQSLMVQLSNTEFLKAMIYSRPSIALVAKFAYDILEVFYSTPVSRP
jgi:hypothetical protein